MEYRYALTLGTRAQAINVEPLFRWEYVRDTRGGTWCRHHLQGTVVVDLGANRRVQMNQWHLPTGYTTLEDVIRFCIVDLALRRSLGIGIGDWKKLRAIRARVRKPATIRKLHRLALSRHSLSLSPPDRPESRAASLSPLSAPVASPSRPPRGRLELTELRGALAYQLL